MQTFLPRLGFDDSAADLDMRRLGKQRVEAKQILIALQARDAGVTTGWQNHPAVRMWRGYEYALTRYGVSICWEWRCRGYSDTLHPYFGEQGALAIDMDKCLDMPPWLGDLDFHLSHQSNLLRKDPDHYAAYARAGVPNDLPYVWPVN